MLDRRRDSPETVYPIVIRDQPMWRQNGRQDVGAGKVVALVQQRFACYLGENIRKTVAEIQSRGMLALAEAPPCLPRRCKLLSGDRGRLDPSCLRNASSASPASAPSKVYSRGSKRLPRQGASSISECRLYEPVGMVQRVLTDFGAVMIDNKASLRVTARVHPRCTDPQIAKSSGPSTLSK